ncbi:MAG: hypothetical protein COB14_00030 [Alphaproteobacteria bacterium]|nr:MAG: hypothetical protein COB14_00030 [Alphaproteobacteria bacterium]
MSENETVTNILVIKLSALGDFIQALGPMAAIRAHHPNAHITLLTTPMFKEFGERSGYFDDIWIDQKPAIFHIPKWLSLRNKLIKGQFTRIYDLQNNDRTSFYFKLLPKHNKPEWVGVAKGASHQNTSPQRTAGHAFDGHKQTLKYAGINHIEIDNLSWINENLSQFHLKPPYILFVPGSAPQHPKKRWPYKKYGALAQKLTDNGYQVVLLGTKTENEITDSIEHICPDVLNLTGQTSLFEIAALAHGAQGAIGNDTGPMHMIGPTDCPSLILFSAQSDPTRHAPKGKNIQTMQHDPLKDLNVDDVLSSLQKVLSTNNY